LESELEEAEFWELSKAFAINIFNDEAKGHECTDSPKAILPIFPVSTGASNFHGHKSV